MPRGIPSIGEPARRFDRERRGSSPLNSTLAASGAGALSRLPIAVSAWRPACRSPAESQAPFTVIASAGCGSGAPLLAPPAARPSSASCVEMAGDLVALLRRVLVAVPGGEEEPLVGLGEVLLHADAARVEDGEIVLAVGDASIGGLAEPLRGGAVVRSCRRRLRHKARRDCAWPCRDPFRRRRDRGRAPWPGLSSRRGLFRKARRAGTARARAPSWPRVRTSARPLHCSPERHGLRRSGPLPRKPPTDRRRARPRATPVRRWRPAACRPTRWRRDSRIARERRAERAGDIRRQTRQAMARSVRRRVGSGSGRARRRRGGPGSVPSPRLLFRPGTRAKPGVALAAARRVSARNWRQEAVPE